MDDPEAALAANRAFYRAFNDGDVDAMDAIWARSSPVFCVHPGWNLLEGRDAIIESWRRILSDGNQPRVVTGGENAQILGDAAIVLCREFVAGTPLTATNLYVLEDNAWKIAHHHSSHVLST